MQTVIYKVKEKFTRNPSFRRFRELPPELRNLIWVFSLPEPCIVALREYHQPIAPPALRANRLAFLTHKFQHVNNQANEQGSVLVYKSQSFAPAMYAACRESRFIFQQFYTQLFQTENSFGTWMDPYKDALYLPLDLCLVGSRFYSTFWQDIADVNILAVNGIYDRFPDESRVYTLSAMSEILDILKAFGNLKWLILVEAEHRPERTADLVRIGCASVEGYEEMIRESLILDDSDSDTFRWPRFSVAVYLDLLEYTGWWHTGWRHDILRKVDVWKDVLKSVSPTHWRLSRFYHRRTN